MHYVKNGPKVDSTIEPQYETCAEVKIAESDYVAYNVTGEQITSTCFDIMLSFVYIIQSIYICKFICAKTLFKLFELPVNIHHCALYLLMYDRQHTIYNNVY